MMSSSGTSQKPWSVSMPLRYLIGFPLGSWIMRKAMVPSVEVAGNILTGTRTRERRRLPDQTGMGAMGVTRKHYSLSRIWDGRYPLQVNKGGPPSAFYIGRDSWPHFSVESERGTAMKTTIVIGALAVSAAVIFMGWYSHSSRITATSETTSSIKLQSTVREGLRPEQIEMLKARRDAPVAEPTP